MPCSICSVIGSPPICPVGKVINELFNITEDENQRVKLSLRKPINTKRIIDHWDTIQRIAVSLAQRKTSQATLVRKLSGYKHNHPLLEALTEYNRLLKAQYLLNYIDDASLRNHVQRALNRVKLITSCVGRSATSTATGSEAIAMRRSKSGTKVPDWWLMPSSTSTRKYSVTCWTASRNSAMTDTRKQSSGPHRSLGEHQLPGTYTFAPTGELPKLEDLMAPIEGYRPRNES